MKNNNNNKWIKEEKAKDNINDAETEIKQKINTNNIERTFREKS